MPATYFGLPKAKTFIFPFGFCSELLKVNRIVTAQVSDTTEVNWLFKSRLPKTFLFPFDL